MGNEMFVGKKIAQFFETENGAMGMIKGIITEICEDKIVFKAKDNGDIPDGEEHIVTVDMFETIM